MRPLCLFVTLAALLAAPVLAQEESVPPSPPADDDAAAAMARMMELGKPGPEHERLAALTGTWDETVNMWTEPGGTPMPGTGRCENEMILGGRFLKVVCESDDGPMKVESLLLLGFDRRHETYTFVGYDTMGTYYVTASGPFDEERNAIVLSGEDEDPVSGFVQKYDIVLHLGEKDRYVTEVIFKNPELTGGAESFKMVEVECTRTR